MLKPLTLGVGFLLLPCAPVLVHAQFGNADATWSFSRQQGDKPLDSTHGIPAKLEGNYAWVSGVSGDALRFDGYTTEMTVSADRAPAAGPNGFTVEALIALNTYPWNWVPIADEESRQQAGYVFEIDAFGHLGFGASINGEWRSVLSTAAIPLKRWARVAASYRTQSGHGRLTVWLDGVAVGDLAVEGEFSPAHTNLVVGRVREPILPFPEAEVKPPIPIVYSLDGLLGQLKFYARGLDRQQLQTEDRDLQLPQGEVLPWVKMPSGPAEPHRFGAYYTSLRYEDAWDRLRQIGENADVVVRFDESPNRLVFWQGTNYVPAWVSGDDKWYTDEFLEVWNDGCPDHGDCEPMSDKQGRFSHVDILESSEARAVVHWRYALAEVANGKGAWHDERRNWSDWADEYWTVYPDGIAVRKQVLHSSHPDAVHEWQETIVLHQPGLRPEDDINTDAITLENMRGESRTYKWKVKVGEAFADPVGPSDPTDLASPNIQWVNLKSRWKPFQIVPPDGVSADFYNNEKSFFTFECWNHWPVAQIQSSDRPCVTQDRPSHSSLSHLFWKPYAEDEGTATKILIDGLTTASPSALLPLARSWVSPPGLDVESPGYGMARYDPTQRAYVLDRAERTEDADLQLTFEASESSPLYDPAILIQHATDADVQFFVDGQLKPPGPDLRITHVHHLESTDLLLWLQVQSTHPVRLEIKPAPH